MRPGSGKLKITYLLLGLAALAGGGGYASHVYSVFRDARLGVPREQVERLIKDARLYHTRTGRMPGSFAEVNELIWRKSPEPDYGPGGRQARTANYYYFLTRVDEQRCAVWAIPLGRQRRYAATYFLVISPVWTRVWKGTAIEGAEMANLPPVPSTDDLADLRMRELPARSLGSQRIGLSNEK